MKECLGGIDWVFNPQHVWNVLNMDDRTRTEINKQLKCITNALWPALLNMQGWRTVVSNWKKKKNPVLPVLEPSTKYGPHFDSGFIPSDSIPDPTRDQGRVWRIYTNEPHQRSTGGRSPALPAGNREEPQMPPRRVNHMKSRFLPLRW